MPKEEKGYWFSTENGTHIHAEEGESKKEAMQKKFTNFGKKEKLTFEKAVKNADNDVLDKQFGKDTPERKLAGAIKTDTFEEINNKRLGVKSQNETESHIKSLKEDADKKNLSFERTLLNDIKSNPEKYNRFTINGSTYVRDGLSFDKYKDGKHISTGTVNSVAADVANSFEDEKPKYQTIADVSSSVKKELKEKGFNTKSISVRGRNVGYSDALDITIKDPSIDIDEVRKLVNKHESYERDASGDILQGGNRYVNVKYEYGLFDSIGEENKAEASKLIEQAKSNNGSGIELGNKHYLFHDKNDNETFIHSNEHGMTPIYSPERLGSYLYQIKKFGRIVSR